MRVIKVAILAFVLSCVVFSGPAEGVEITPIIVSMPDLPGEIFSFDFVITDIDDLTREAQGFEAVISVSGLTGNEAGSIEVRDELAYWLLPNNSSPVFVDHGDNSYTFNDGPDDGIAQPLATDDIMARYAFTWDGTVGDYIFTIDLSTDNSFILLENFNDKEALRLPDLPWSSGRIDGVTSNSFAVPIPEPTTLMLIGMGGLVLLRKRRAHT
ncbi:MAG: PEP-CTERM sorting domain-containing protein [Planctomycetota bacterium]